MPDHDTAPTWMRLLLAVVGVFILLCGAGLAFAFPSSGMSKAWLLLPALMLLVGVWSLSDAIRGKGATVSNALVAIVAGMASSC